jgi:hypothetical protein
LYPPSKISGFGWVSGSFQTVSLLEAFDAPCGIDQFLFPGKERVAGRTHFEPYFRFGGAGLELVSAGAADEHFVVFRMNSFFHFDLVFGHTPQREARGIKQ